MQRCKIGFASPRHFGSPSYIFFAANPCTRRDENFDGILFFLPFFFYQMSDTVYVIRYIGMLSRARDPLLSHCIFSARESPLTPSFIPFRVIVFEWNKNCIGGDAGRLSIWATNYFHRRLQNGSTHHSCDFRACKGSIHFRLPLGRVARNCVTSARQTDCFVTRTKCSQSVDNRGQIMGRNYLFILPFAGFNIITIMRTVDNL